MPLGDFVLFDCHWELSGWRPKRGVIRATAPYLGQLSGRYRAASVHFFTDGSTYKRLGRAALEKHYKIADVLRTAAQRRHFVILKGQEKS